MLILSLGCFIFSRMIYGLIFLNHRTSAIAQRQSIVQFAENKGYTIDDFLSYSDLPDLTRVKPGDSVIFYAWYCVGKTRPQLKKTIKYLIENRIYFYSATSDFCADQKFNFDQLAHAFALYEDMRFNFISDKNLDAVNRRIAMGCPSGRHKGTKNKRHVWDAYESQILSMYKSKQSMYSIAKELKLTAPAVKRCLAANNVDIVV